MLDGMTAESCERQNAKSPDRRIDLGLITTGNLWLPEPENRSGRAPAACYHSVVRRLPALSFFLMASGVLFACAKAASEADSQSSETNGDGGEAVEGGA